MATIATPSSGSPITDAWGESVADAINHVYDGRGYLAVPLGFSFESAANQTDTLEAVSSGLAGGCLIPYALGFGMQLTRHRVRNMDTSGLREWEVALYENDGAGVLIQVPGTYARETFVPSAASWQDADLDEAVYLEPGAYFQVIRNVSTTNTFGVGARAGATGELYSCWADGTMSALGEVFDPEELASTMSQWVRQAALGGETAQGAGPFP